MSDRLEELKKYEFPTEKIEKSHYLALFYTCLLVSIGLPIWWSYTGTYRASLPYSEINQINSEEGHNISIKVEVHIVSFDNWISLENLGEFELDLRNSLNTNNKAFVNIHYDITTRPSSAQESQILRTSSTMDEFESSFRSAQPSASYEKKSHQPNSPDSQTPMFAEAYWIFLLPSEHVLWNAVSGPGKSAPPGAGLVRHGGGNSAPMVITYLRTNSQADSTNNLKDVQDRIVRLMRHVLVRDQELQNIYLDSLALFNLDSVDTIKASMNAKQQRDKARVMTQSPKYDVNLLLVIAKSDEFKKQGPADHQTLSPKWHLSDALRISMEPLLSQLNRFVTVHVTSQFLYGIDLEHEARKSRLFQPEKVANSSESSSSSSSYHYYLVDDLPHLINPIEFYSSNPVSAAPQMNFVTYVPASNVSPLYIMQKSTDSLKMVPNNAFLVSQWGGIFIYNHHFHQFNEDIGDVLRLFSYQMMTLLGLDRHVPRIIVPLEDQSDNKHPIAANWQIQSWLRLRCVSQMAHTSLTLRSMVLLLNTVSNLVLPDAAAEHVFSSVKAYNYAVNQLKHAGDVKSAFLSSQSALTSAEKAFFDPALLELLYFPDDQKHGIYMPLFLPLILYVFIATYKAVKYFIAKRKLAKAKPE